MPSRAVSGRRGCSGARRDGGGQLMFARDSLGCATSRTRESLPRPPPLRTPTVVAPIEHRPQRSLHLLDLPLHCLQPRARPLVRPGIVPEDHLHVARHQVQGRACLVRHVGGHLSERGHPLGARERFARREQRFVARRELGSCAARDRAWPRQSARCSDRLNPSS